MQPKGILVHWALVALGLGQKVKNVEISKEDGFGHFALEICGDFSDLRNLRANLVNNDKSEPCVISDSCDEKIYCDATPGEGIFQVRKKTFFNSHACGVRY